MWLRFPTAKIIPMCHRREITVGRGPESIMCPHCRLNIKGQKLQLSSYTKKTGKWESGVRAATRRKNSWRAALRQKRSTICTNFIAKVSQIPNTARELPGCSFITLLWCSVWYLKEHIMREDNSRHKVTLRLNWGIGNVKKDRGEERFEVDWDWIQQWLNLLNSQSSLCSENHVWIYWMKWPWRKHTHCPS